MQSAINVSEGQNTDIIRAIVDSASSYVTVVDWSADADHNRMVITLLGSPSQVEQGAIAVARTAVERIDLNKHSGEHPRMGVVDVIPFTPIRDVSMQECIELSERVGAEIGSQLKLPVHLYAESVRPGRVSELPTIRSSKPGELCPDFGPATPHPTAGTVVVGARGPLVAWNLLIDRNDLAATKSIARQIRLDRTTNNSLLGVRAIGLSLPSVKKAQVSMNVTKPELTPFDEIFEKICHYASQQNVSVVESEFIGLVPLRCFGNGRPLSLLWKDFKETQTVEYWLNTL